MLRVLFFNANTGLNIGIPLVNQEMEGWQAPTTESSKEAGTSLDWKMIHVAFK